MSYLNSLRLHFSGKFQASVSTVNNDPEHYNNDTFEPNYQELQQPGQPNGWWNPTGDASWRFLGVTVNSAFYADGTQVEANDAILTCLIGDNDRSVAAKLVDLDPQQQLVSQVWGWEVRIVNQNYQTLLRAKYKPAAFTDIWARALAKTQGDQVAGSMYQSVLTDLEWNDELLGTSRFLTELKQASETSQKLSIKFNVDGFNMDYTSPDFTKGRVVGTIGPACENEPDHFVNGRQLLAANAPNNNGFFLPQDKINFCTAFVDKEARKVFLDLGNALPTNTAGGALAQLGTLALVVEDSSSGIVVRYPIDAFSYGTTGWYEATAGVVALPSDRQLTDEELERISRLPMALLRSAPNGLPLAGVSERPDGLFVRADQFVFRLNPDDQASVRLYATQFGEPLTNAKVLLIPDASQLDPTLPIATPTEALEYPTSVLTNEAGVATFEFIGHDPQNPRGYIDGQVYGVRPLLEATVNPLFPYPANPSNFISVLLWNKFVPSTPITWYGTQPKSADGMKPIFQQYENLYPVMKRFIDLGDYEQISQNRQLLLLAFGLDESNPNAMPVTRDLSKFKLDAILSWLSEENLEDGKPRLGTEPAVATNALLSVAPETKAYPQHLSDPKGGKKSALERRLINHMTRGHFGR